MDQIPPSTGNPIAAVDLIHSDKTLLWIGSNPTSGKGALANRDNHDKLCLINDPPKLNVIKIVLGSSRHKHALRIVVY